MDLCWLKTGFFHLRRHVLVDTPGQIEIFTWSASGTGDRWRYLRSDGVCWVIRGHHNRVAGIIFPHRDSLCCGHAQMFQPDHVYE